jgi:uncharacterized protein YktA (UPF0223 family)
MNTNEFIENQNIIEKIKFVASDFLNTMHKKRLLFLAENAINAIKAKNAFNITSFDQYDFRYLHKTQKEIELLDIFLSYVELFYEKNDKRQKKELLDIQKYYKHIVDTEVDRKVWRNKQTGEINI